MPIVAMGRCGGVRNTHMGVHPEVHGLGEHPKMARIPKSGETLGQVYDRKAFGGGNGS